MNPEFDVQLNSKDLYRFNMRRTYTSMQGPVSIIIAILFVVSGVVSAINGKYQYLALYVAVAILFAFYIPVTLHQRAKKTMATNEVLSGVLHFTFTEDAICVKSGEETGELPWKGVFKMTSTKKYVYIYSNRLNAYIIPREQMGESYAAVKELAVANLERFRVKMK